MFSKFLSALHKNWGIRRGREKSNRTKVLKNYIVIEGSRPRNQAKHVKIAALYGLKPNETFHFIVFIVQQHWEENMHSAQ